NERRLERDRRPGERLRDRAALLRLLGDRLEARGVGPGRGDLGGEVDAGDRESVALAVEANVGVRLDALRLDAGLLEAEREGHRETAGQRRSDHLLGVARGLALEARARGER